MGQKSEWRGKSGTILGDFMQYKPWHYGKLSLRGEGGVSVEKIFFGDSDSKFSVLSPAFYGI